MFSGVLIGNWEWNCKSKTPLFKTLAREGKKKQKGKRGTELKEKERPAFGDCLGILMESHRVVRYFPFSPLFSLYLLVSPLFKSLGPIGFR